MKSAQMYIMKLFLHLVMLDDFQATEKKKGNILWQQKTAHHVHNKSLGAQTSKKMVTKRDDLVMTGMTVHGSFGTSIDIFT